MGKNKQIVIRVTETLRDDFIEHCKQNGYSISKRLRLLIERDINEDDRLDK